VMGCSCSHSGASLGTGADKDAHASANAGATCRVHRSGLPFPDELLERFQIDLKCIVDKLDRWGAKQPPMPRVVPWPAVDGKESDRKRIEEAALFYVAVSALRPNLLIYAHHHHPDWLGEDGHGVDCSNLASHIYNLVLGVRFTSAIGLQSELPLPRLTKWDELRRGDLAFFTNWKRDRVSHSGIIIKHPDGTSTIAVVHSTGARQTKNHLGKRKHTGPQITTLRSWWPINRFSHGFRIVDINGLP